MCRTLRLLFLVFTLFITGIAWGAADPLNIQVTGLSADLQANVKSALNHKKAPLPKPINAEGVQDFYKNAPRIIQEALQPYGYFHSTTRSQLIRKGNQWTAIFNITPGPPVYITQVLLTISGPAKEDPPFQKLYENLPIKAGQILNTQEYEKTKQLVYDLASTRGYFNSTMLENRIYINLKTNEAKINITFNSGPRYFFGHTFFSETPFSPSFLKRFLRYEEGAPYDYHKIDRTQQDLSNSNYFSQVIMTPLPHESKNLDVPIQVKLIPRKRFAYILGAGFGTDTGPRATLGFEMRRVNQYGHQLKALLQPATQNSYGNITYNIPGRHPASDIWGFTTGYANFNQVTGNGRGFKVEANYTTSIWKIKQTAALTYLDERYNIVNFPFVESNVLYPNVTWQYLSTDNRLHPKFGFTLSGFLGGAPEIITTTDSFVQGRLDGKILFTLFNTTRLIFRSSLARTQIDNIQSLPFSLQLFTGGAQSVRGYSYNQIGPGKNLFVGSGEIQQKIKGDIYLVGFIDAGNVTDDNPFKNLNIGVGPGLAYLSPVGLIEVTVANAITQPNKPWVVQFSMGPVL